METAENTLSVNEQQYNLKWTNHTSNMLQVFAEQLSKESLVDVTLSCDGYFIKAHKIVLSACSLYFQKLFDTHTLPHPIIIMNGIRFCQVQQIINFMYRGEIKVADADLDDLLALAENLKVKGLCNVRRNIPKNSTEEAVPETPEDQNRKAKKRRKTQHSPSPEKTDDQGSKFNGEPEPAKPKIVPESMFAEAEGLVKVENTHSEQHNVPTQKLTKKPKPGKLNEDTDITGTNDWSSDETCGKVSKELNSKIPRPPNAFMIFANEWRKKLAVENPGESNKDISVRLGNMWKSLSAQKKDSYYCAAKKADEEHKAKYPGYYYSPKEARIRKEIKSATYRRGIKSFNTAFHLVKLVVTENNKIKVPTDEEVVNLDEKEAPALIINDNICAEEELSTEENHM